MNTKLMTLLAAASLAVAPIAYGQSAPPSAAPAKSSELSNAPRDLNKEAEAQKSSAGKGGTPTPSVKEKRGKLETPEQKQAAGQELQKRSTSSASGGPAVVDPNAKKANPRKAYKDMTPEEKKEFDEIARKASKP
jgi:hypothetical protein